MRLTLFACILLLLSNIGCSEETVYRKVIHNTDPEAKCLDGSPGLLYIHEGSQTDKFLLFFIGGGLCGAPTLPSTLESCYKRSKTELGSSLFWPETISSEVGGYLALNQSLYKNWTKVLFGYCDGSLHQGHSETAVSYKDSKLYFRGSKIVRSHLKWLVQQHKLDQASKVMLTGGSAGGVAAYLWGNYVQTIVKPQNVFIVPDSGIFVNSETYDSHQPLIGLSIQNLAKVANVDEKTPLSECNSQFPGEEYKCLFLQQNYRYLEGKYLFINSQYDQWALENIIRTRCLKDGKSGQSLSGCSQEQMSAIEAYRSAYLKLVANLTGRGMGIWTIACSNHVYAAFEQFYSAPEQRVPADTGFTVKDAIEEFVLQEKIGKAHIDQSNWPGNKPCAF